MERLTHTNKGMAWYKSDLLLLEPCELSYSQVGEVLRRLAAYEDTGLTPEELKRLKDLTVLRIEKPLTDDELEELRRVLKQQPGTLRVLTETDLNADTCVCCGEIIPEGRQVCPPCEMEAGT